MAGWMRTEAIIEIREAVLPCLPCGVIEEDEDD
jgi:hypothetical protein